MSADAVAEVTQVRPRMGTLLAVSAAGVAAGAAARYAADVFDTVAACERVMSRHRADAALARLNAEGVVVSRELARALALARRLSAATAGAFDPTVEPLMALWRRAARHGPPTRRRLRAAVRRVGWHGLALGRDRVRLGTAGMALDLGAIGKGIALDRAAARLRRSGCRAAFLNFGESSLLAIGRPPRGRWRVALRHPLGGFAGTFTLRDRACSTSATLGRTTRVGGPRVGHVVDPRTGRPLDGVAQVTVLARSAAVAEALSTAVLVLGRDAMDSLARAHGADACWIDAQGVATTPWFPLRGDGVAR